MSRQLLAILFLVLATPALGEHYWLPRGVTGLVKADLSIELRECTAPIVNVNDCPAISDAAVTVSEAAIGHYLIAGLPDAVAGSSTSYALLGTADGVPFVYVWPRGTITPQSTSAIVSYRVPSTVILAAGDTLPAVEATVAGLTADPTGATVTFDLWSVSGTKVLNAVTATVVDVDAQVNGTWTATLQHAWTVAETSALSGSYYGRFNVTFAAGGTMTIPPAPNSLQVRVFP